MTKTISFRVSDKQYQIIRNNSDTIPCSPGTYVKISILTLLDNYDTEFEQSDM